MLAASPLLSVAGLLNLVATLLHILAVALQSVVRLLIFLAGAPNGLVCSLKSVARRLESVAGRLKFVAGLL